MTLLRGAVLLGGQVCLLSLCATVSGSERVIRASAWMLVQTSIASGIAVLLGLGAAVVARPRSLPYLHQFVSRGVELAAALPMILVCGVLAVAIPAPVPIAAAAVVGILAGLRCVRIVAASSSAIAQEHGLRPNWRLLRENLRHTIPPTVPTMIEQIVGLEAAIAWLGLFERDWSGGWGEQLGQAARLGQILPLATWTMAAVFLSVGLKAVFWRMPGQGGADSVPEQSQPR